jgi:hypothetical protein
MLYPFVAEILRILGNDIFYSPLPPQSLAIALEAVHYQLAIACNNYIAALNGHFIEMGNAAVELMLSTGASIPNGLVQLPKAGAHVNLLGSACQLGELARLVKRLDDLAPFLPPNASGDCRRVIRLKKEGEKQLDEYYGVQDKLEDEKLDYMLRDRGILELVVHRSERVLALIEDTHS